MRTKEQNKLYYLANKERCKRNMRRFAKEHPEVNKLSAKKYREAYPERRALSNILQRCNNPRNHAYESYGGRGIRCFFKNADEMIADIGKRPSSKYSIDRIDNEGHYEIGNIRWATRKQQANNRRNCQNLIL